MPFFLDGNPTQGEISEAVNYLLSNFTQNVSADQGTGQIIGPGGNVQSYLYKYMYIKYATSFDGTVGFSNVPTNATYYGLRNTDDPTESTNPADYIWTKVTPGFGTTYFLYYLTTGGRSIQFQEATSVPNPGWQIDPGTSIDLDLVTNITNTPANFVVIRTPNNSSAPTNAEVLSAIGRLPISGDLCTINYNSGIASIEYKYTTGWAVFQKYITGDLIVAQSIVGNNIAANTITAGNIAANTITAGQIAANTITASQIASNTITAGQIAANTITAGNMNVSQLSAITANLGTVTAGEVIIGSSPAISGTTMTGTGSHIYTDGRFITGNSSKNLVFDGSNLYLNGIGSATFGGLNSGIQMPLSPSGTSPTGYVDSFSVSKAGYIQITLTGEVLFSSNSTLYTGVYAPVTVSINKIVGGVLPGTATGITDTFHIRLVAPAVVPSLGAPPINRLQLPLSWTRIANFSIGTYAVFICSDAAFYDTSGVLGYSVPVSDRLFNGRIDVYQPTV